MDASGNGNNGTNFGAVAAPDRFGNANGCMCFSNSAYIAAAADTFPTNTRTITLWFKLNDVSGRPALMGYGGGYCGSSFFMCLNHWGDGCWVATSHCDEYTLAIPYDEPPQTSGISGPLSWTRTA